MKHTGKPGAAVSPCVLQPEPPESGQGLRGRINQKNVD
ncbi:hypothetical protein [Polaromonas sp. CG9_12]|nr:hypothetical protein [Polaromonas sp. CG9_12]